jgi:3-hydroxyacyl-[acyl-carrier-protein] dehydratase
LLDEIVEQGANRIVCKKTFKGDEFWYAGHYPHFPITPGVLLCEAAMQAGAVLLATMPQFKELAATTGGVPVAARANNIQFKKMVLPGDTVLIEAQFVEKLASAFFLNAKVTVRGKLATKLDFACMLAKPGTLQGEGAANA